MLNEDGIWRSTKTEVLWNKRRRSTGKSIFGAREKKHNSGIDAWKLQAFGVHLHTFFSSGMSHSQQTCKMTPNHGTPPGIWHPIPVDGIFLMLWHTDLMQYFDQGYIFSHECPQLYVFSNACSASALLWFRFFFSALTFIAYAKQRRAHQFILKANVQDRRSKSISCRRRPTSYIGKWMNS